MSAFTGWPFTFAFATAFSNPAGEAAAMGAEMAARLGPDGSGLVPDGHCDSHTAAAEVILLL